MSASEGCEHVGGRWEKERERAGGRGDRIRRLLLAGARAGRTDRGGRGGGVARRHGGDDGTDRAAGRSRSRRAVRRGRLSAPARSGSRGPRRAAPVWRCRGAVTLGRPCRPVARRGALIAAARDSARGPGPHTRGYPEALILARRNGLPAVQRWDRASDRSGQGSRLWPQRLEAAAGAAPRRRHRRAAMMMPAQRPGPRRCLPMAGGHMRPAGSRAPRQGCLGQCTIRVTPVPCHRAQHRATEWGVTG